MPLLLTAAAVVLVAGIAVLWFGLRGRRSNNHPVCRACGFDLVGTYPSLLRCPECGAGLDGPRAIRTGHRVRRRWAVRVGLLACVAGAALAAVGAWGAANQYDWNRAKPLWWLARDAASQDLGRAAAATQEVIRRIARGDLTAATAAPFVSMALREQASPAHVTRYGRGLDWSDVLCQADRAGLLSAEERLVFLRQGLNPLPLSFPPRIRTGTAVEFRPAVEFGPFGSRPPRLRLVLRSLTIEAEGLVIEANSLVRGKGEREVTTGGSDGRVVFWPQGATLDLSTGDVPVTVRQVIDVFESDRSDTEPMFTVTRTLEQVARVLALDAPPDLVIDERHRRAIGESVSVSELAAARWRDTTLFEIKAETGSAPVQNVARLILLADGREYSLGRVYSWGPEGSMLTVETADPLPERLPPFVDLILRPDAEAARRLWYTQVWGRDIVFRRVPVKWMGEISNPYRRPSFEPDAQRYSPGE